MTRIARSVHLWAPNMFEFKGGIQTFSAFALGALQALQPPLQLRVCLKNDTQVTLPAYRQAQTTFSFAGRAPRGVRTAYFAALLILRAALERPDLIVATHIHFTKVSRWIKRVLGIPYWVVVHGEEGWKIQDRALRDGVCEADRVIAVSSFTRDRLLETLPLDPARVVIVPNTFDEKRFVIETKSEALAERYGLRPESRVILTVARLDSEQRYKGYDQILACLARLRARIPGILYLLVGSGPDRERVENLARTLGVWDVVRLAGLVPDEELAAHYQLADVFAMPSRGEGFGIVYLEALGCGVSVLAGNRDGSVDALNGGELGVLIDPENQDEIAAALESMLTESRNDAASSSALARRARTVELFGNTAFNRCIQRLFES